ncbi:hypothetical protein [Ruegeria sp. PrR005]|uniref:Succinate dehydrogenase n=1 Tax=Ruegeria sp. PrR005 TaxID=2706882 RepID=A0A6B2NW83_9RHOB|nr:hypothetical protein [Ruegeria sp. PrR005]NDW46155.1 hypothetical protein [Ruegeria sp. PrR005]
MIARKIHRWNGAVFAAFLLLHFITHLSGLWGVNAYNATQDVLRLIYRNPVVEPLVLTSALVQMGLGLKLLIARVRRGLREPWARAQVISGGLVLYFMTEHVIALALARWVDGLDTNFYWPASVMSGAPFTWYFIPYYSLGVIALFVHLGCAFRLILLRRGARAQARAVFWGMTLAGGTIAALIVAMLLGAFYDIALPPDWLAYLRQFVPGFAP